MYIWGCWGPPLRDCWVLLHAPWGSLGSSRVVGFLSARPWGRCVFSVSLSSLAYALVVVSFTLSYPGSHYRPLGSLAYTLAVFVSIRCLWVFVRKPLGGSCGTSGFVGLAGGYSGGRWVHSSSLGSLVRALESVGFIRGLCVHLRAFWGSLGSLACAWVFVGFICGCWAHSREPWWSFGSCGLTPGCRCVHSRAP